MKKYYFLTMWSLWRVFVTCEVRLNDSSGSEAAGTARTRIGWINLEDVRSCLVEESFDGKEGFIRRKISKAVRVRDMVSEEE